ncbi:MAG: hypothetical protein FJZ11_05335, partial [Candidatus Omnitrophica bacterium]|nr:hypothetical protein [Candidatus Omnitrophota bacterium]
MAIAKIKKIEIIGLEKDKDDFISRLQGLGIVEITEYKKEDKAPAIINKTRVNLIETEENIAFLSGFKQTSNFLESMFSMKPWVLRDKIQELVQDFDY